ncbi:DUF6064 family protein [Massilia sp. 9I]|uniref:DUF6064 family protein n=1 Tax=Massilia sp. 9I TaxID=2653152 RepID=UPI0012F41446|nr:DUF6064 family protein [Massilia sp. 9I]VXC42894.1 conserved membrane hypothetical protein [Massilia sp. 9I]
MSEWWTYSLSDFLMFSARTYYRQFALMNREWWPLHLLAFAAGIALLVCMRRAGGARIGFALLAVAWAWTGWAYHLQRYADINTGAPYFAAGFFLQAALLAWMAQRPQAPVDHRGHVALVLLVVALAYPALAPLNGRALEQAEMFGFAPDPTAVATLAALLAWRARWPLWVIPLLWCGASSATQHELHAAQAWLPAVLALLALGWRFRR